MQTATTGLGTSAQPVKGIEYMTEPYSRETIISHFHPFVQEWFTATFSDFTPPQLFSILNIAYRKNTLICSPTGSGKTLSAFLAVLNELVTLADAGTLENKVYCIYVSPLKALGNDIERNLTEPLNAIREIAKKHGKELDIRVAVRTGDTTAHEKQKMLTKTPHILITTPESLAIMQASIKFSLLLRDMQWVVVDEIHSIAASKRGVHLSFVLEQLAEHTNFTRIGLSATVAPLTEFAQYLVGYRDDGTSRGCSIADSTLTKGMDLQVVSPVKNLIDTDYNVIQSRTYDLMHELIQQHRTTLIFTNTRSATERVVHHLKEKFNKHYITVEEHIREEKKANEGKNEIPSIPVEQNTTNSPIIVKSVIAAHHSSLSKEHRLTVEERLKKGDLRVVVSSTSLEMGIDIGSIDLVILLGSPKSVSRALQRIGRAGHRLSDVSKGRIIVTDRDDLVECSVLLRSAIERKVDRIHIPRNCLDVLAQCIYGVAVADKRQFKDIYHLAKRSYCYHTLTLLDFEQTIKYLSGEFTALEDRHTYAKIWYDQATGEIGRRGKLARLLFMTNTGTIPDETNIIVKVGDIPIGSIAEPFLERLKRGDVFVLGGDTYEFLFARGTVAQVRASAGRLPTVPSWYSEMLPLNYDLATEIQRFRQYLAQLFEQDAKKEEIINYISGYVSVNNAAAEAMYDYFREQHKFSKIPHLKRLVIEKFKDGSKQYVVFHTLFGRRVNDALSRIVAYRLGKLYHTDVEIGITDNGFFIMTRQTVLAKRVIELLRDDEIPNLLEHAIHNSEVLRRRFRHCATRSLMILRQYKGMRKSVGKQQVSSQTLLAAVRRLGNDFPILKEARREVMDDVMDAPHAIEVVQMIINKTLSIEEINLEMASPFSFTIVLQGYSDILKIEDKQGFLMRMHQEVLARIEGRKPAVKLEAGPSMSHEVTTSNSFNYEEHWAAQEKANELTAEELRLLLKEQLYRAARKDKLSPEIVFEASRLIDGEPLGYSESFITWLQTLLGGTIPKYYEDELVKYFFEKLSDIRSQ